MTSAQIKHQVDSTWAIQIQMAYMRLVMVQFYAHKPKKSSQWLEIDEKRGILQASTKDF
jgi:hypothetical protein